MKVQDLRQKLADFGEKNRQHYEQSQKPVDQLSSSSTEMVDIDQNLQMEELDALAIDTKPSLASTSPSSSCDDDYSHATTTIMTQNKVVLGPFLNKQVVHRSYSFDSSSGSESTLSPPKLYSSASDIDNVTGKEHLELLEKQAPNVHSESPVEKEVEEETFFKQSASGSMHNSTLLKGGLLTKSSLDALCQEETTGEEPPAPRSSSTATSVLSTSDDIYSMKSIESEHEDKEAPAIVPGALGPKIATVFFQDTNDDAIPEGKKASNDSVIVRRKKINPEDLPFLKTSFITKEANEPVVIARRKQITPDDLPFLKTTVRMSDPKTPDPKPRSTPVGQGIRKFGGCKSQIERRKEELSKKWAECNSVVFVKKETWEFCQRKGGYKKKVFVEKEVKDEQT
jgi:hypothetical protein